MTVAELRLVARQKRTEVLDYLDESRILLSAAASSATSCLLRLVEPLARRGIAVRPLDLYGAILNGNYMEKTIIRGPDGEDPFAAVFSILLPSIQRTSVSLAVLGAPLKSAEDRGIQILALLTARGRRSEACRTLNKEAVELLTPSSCRATLLQAATAREAVDILRNQVLELRHRR